MPRKRGGMKKLVILAAIAMAALSVSAQAASVTTKGGYEYDKNRLSDPSTLNWNVEQCSHSAITPDAQARLAKLMNVPGSKVRLEFCRRVLTAYARGTIPYEDYVQFAQSSVMAPSFARALRISASSLRTTQGSGQGEVVLPASAKMDSGETFKGSTIASHGRGRFSVKSSRRSVKCSGTYDLKDRRPTVTLAVKCSDGRTGQAEVTRAEDFMSAWGKVKLSDGSTGRLVVGDARK